MKKHIPFTGCGTAIITPFTESGVDLGSFGELIEWQIASGVDALIVCGTTGEPSTMTDEEKAEVIGFAVRTADGRVPIIAGTGGNDTRKVIDMSLRAQELGADALLIVTPYYNKTTQHGLIAHFTAVADSVNLPIIIYNVPVRTGLNMTAATLSALADHPRICGMKEASGDIVQITEMFRLCHERIAIYSGNDDQIVPFLGLGGEGVVSVLSNICPAQVQEMVATFHEGNLARSRQLQFEYNPLTQALFCEVSPVPVKTALNLMGRRAGPVRLPLTPMLDENLARLKREMQAVGLL